MSPDGPSGKCSSRGVGVKSEAPLPVPVLGGGWGGDGGSHGGLGGSGAAVSPTTPDEVAGASCPWALGTVTPLVVAPVSCTGCFCFNDLSLDCWQMSKKAALESPGQGTHGVGKPCDLS